MTSNERHYKRTKKRMRALCGKLAPQGTYTFSIPLITCATCVHEFIVTQPRRNARTSVWEERLKQLKEQAA